MIRVKGSCPISPLWPPHLINWLYTYGDHRPEDPTTQEVPYKNNLPQPSWAVVPEGECDSWGNFNLPLFQWPDPNPAGRYYNYITEASCYCCSLHCLKTHNWIEEFMIFLLFFGLTLPTPFIVFIQAICPARAPSSILFPDLCLQLSKWRTAGLKVLLLNWQGCFPF